VARDALLSGIRVGPAIFRALRPRDHARGLTSQVGGRCSVEVLVGNSCQPNKLGASGKLYSPKCLEGEFFEVRGEG
jgi:hypothetical protein